MRNYINGKREMWNEINFSKCWVLEYSERWVRWRGGGEEKEKRESERWFKWRVPEAARKRLARVTRDLAKVTQLEEQCPGATNLVCIRAQGSGPVPSPAALIDPKTLQVKCSKIKSSPSKEIPIRSREPTNSHRWVFRLSLKILIKIDFVK